MRNKGREEGWISNDKRGKKANAGEGWGEQEGGVKEAQYTHVGTSKGLRECLMDVCT